MSTFENNMIRYRLMWRHRELVRGSAFDMQVARRILRFLIHGEARMGYCDEDWTLEHELENAGVRIRYAGRNYTAYARIKRRS